MNNNTLLVAKWVSKVIPVVRYIILVMMAIIAVATIALVFMQIGQGGNSTNVVTGNADSYYSQNKGGSREGRITRLIYICVGLLVILSILFFVTFNIYDGEFI
ncbi:MAG: preprotein translocase subunit SecG [Clostridia bacterium]|nr:preprotein translocase subunit SecG [Clostridia bacterium]